MTILQVAFTVAFFVVVIAFILQSVAIVYYVLRSDKRQARTAEVQGRHDLLTLEKATEKTDALLHSIETIPSKTAAALMEQAAGVEIPAPPPPPAASGFTLKDSVKLIIAGSLLSLGVGTTLLAATLPEGNAMDTTKAREQFYAGHYQAAEQGFLHAGEHCRAAECALAAGRHDDALNTLREVHTARAEYIRGLVAMDRGDPAAARTLFVLAEEMGEVRARQILERMGA